MQHDAAEVADVPVEGIAVVAHVLVLDVEAAVLQQLCVGETVEVRLGIVEHPRREEDDLAGIAARDARMAVENRRGDGHVAVRLSSARVPCRREARVDGRGPLRRQRESGGKNE